jgi:tetratricopeptide (TPR) repeat protein
LKPRRSVIGRCTSGVLLLFATTTFLFRAEAQVDSTGIKLIEQRKYAEAKSFFEAALKANSKDADAHYQLARVLLRQGNSDDAEDEIDEALELNDLNARYHFLRGQILGEKAQNANIFKQGILAPKVKNAFLRAVALDPSLIDARVGLYNYYIMAPGIMGGSDDEALKQANEVMKLNSTRGHILLANFYQRKKDFTQAEAEYKKIIDDDPKKIDGYKALGYFYVNQKEFDQAVAQFNKYVDLDPKNPDAHDSYGDALFAQEKFDEAIEKYSFALSLDKNFASSIYQLAACYEKKGLKTKAIETYQWYLAVQPSGRNADSARKKIKELS